MNSLKNFGLSSSLALGIGAMTLFASPASAAEQLVLTFDPFRSAISIAELRTFADTGVPSANIATWLRLGRIEAETFREILTQKVTVNQLTADRLGNSRPGELVLRQLGNSFQTRSGQANVQALRAALVLGTAGDNQISILEFLEKYPTQALLVNGRSLLTFSRDVNNIRDKVQAVVSAVEGFVSDRVCNCQPASGQQN